MTDAAGAPRPRLSTPARVLIALLLGAAVGLLLAAFDPVQAATVADAVQPIGRLWLNALQMTVVPLVAALVVVGINSAADAAASGRTARIAIVVFLVLLALSGTFAAIAAPAFLSMLPRDEALIATFRAAIQAPENLPDAPGIGAWLANVIPNNAIAAAANSAMLPLVVFAMFFGFGLTRIEPERRARMLELVRTIGDTMIVVVRWVLWAAPLGVFALVLAVCARVGLDMLSALGYYILTQCALYIAITLLLYAVALLAAGILSIEAALAPASARNI